MMKTLAEKINDPTSHLVDVRTPHEVDEVSVEGAENIPLDTVPHNLDRFHEMEKKGEIVLFCRSGGRSEQAAGFLRQNGIQNVVNAGGYADVQSLLNK